MALAIQLAAYFPEVLAMQIPICPRHRLPMIEVDNAKACFKCDVPGCDQTADLPPMGDAGQAPPDDGGGPARRLPDTYECQSVDLRGEAHRTPPGGWLAHIGIKWPLYPVMQSNARDDYSIMNGPAAPGGGGSKSGRRRKKTKGGKKFTDSPWGAEGGTNTRK